MAVHYGDPSEDLELLEVSLPGSFNTQIVRRVRTYDDTSQGRGPACARQCARPLFQFSSRLPQSKLHQAQFMQGVTLKTWPIPKGPAPKPGPLPPWSHAGEREIVAAYVVAGSALPVTPCGGCRQKLAEFSDSAVKVTMATTGGVEQVMTMAQLLPGAFGKAHMDGDA